MNITALKWYPFLVVLFLLFHPAINAQNPPTFLSAETSVNGKSIELSFDKNMADPSGQESSFSLDISIAVTSVMLKSGNPQVLVLDLDERVHYGQSVTVSYMQGTVESEDGGLLGSFSESVINSVVQPPTLIVAQTNSDGDIVELQFDKPMEAPVNSTSQFTVNAGAAIAVMQINLKVGDEKTLVLNLDNKIAFGEAVYISYVEGNISSTDGGLLDAFDNEPIQNNVPEPPRFVSAATNAQGDKIELSFNKNMGDPIGELSQFTVSNGKNQAIESISLKSGDAGIIILTMQQQLGKQDVITVSYEKGNLQSADGGVLDGFTSQPVANNIQDAPIMLAAVSSEDGFSIELAFDQSMKDPSGEQTSFSISESSENSIAKVELNQAQDSLFTLTLQNAISFGETVSISYTMGNVESGLAVLLNSFTDSSVVNNVKETTSVSDRYLSQSVSVFPNPCNGKFNIKTNGLFDSGTKLDIITLSGEIILSKQINNKSANPLLSVDLKNTAKGMYFINIYDKKRRVAKKILVK